MITVHRICTSCGRTFSFKWLRTETLKIPMPEMCADCLSEALD